MPLSVSHPIMVRISTRSPLQNLTRSSRTRCELSDSSDGTSAEKENVRKLEIGTAIIFVEAPPMIKTATSMPCLRVNSGLVKAGDVGRIMSRKPKDVWAIRLAIGTYLIDGKFFKPLELAETLDP
ncbi:hypothetical protein MLD38_017209 [Melastoma candidum]|uniref:Uncharacterized protein n=1 Tax=Melastoma candidum TaxID=119954 RepID=A0ACB9QY42_9MYRT|nr:hypothetical protein MLD38_017209 [Melastoma candidum]